MRMAGIVPSDQPAAPRADSPAWRILMIAACPFPAPQGSQVLVAGLAGALAEAGAEVWLLTYPGGVGQAPKGVSHLTCGGIGLKPRIRAGPWAGKLLLNQMLRASARWAIQAESPGVIHAHNIEALRIAAPLARAAQIPVVYGVHGLMASELPTYFGAWPVRQAARMLGQGLDRWAARRADGFHALTQADARALRALGVAPDRIHIGAPGMDVEAFDRVEPRLPPGISLGEGRPLIVYGGNLDGYQGLETLRRAFGRVRAHKPSAGLVLASHHESGPYGRLRRRWAGEPGAQFARIRDFGEMKGLLTAADILVNPRSTPGGFPVKLLNCMAAGKPIVSCRGSAGALEDGRDALLVEDGDAEAFAASLLRLAEDGPLRERLGRAARQRVELEFRWEDRIKELIAFYSRLRK